MSEIKCSVKKIIYQNEKNGWGVAVCRLDNGFKANIAGNMAGIAEGMDISARGHWEDDSKYGREFKVSSCVECLPRSEDKIFEYLSSGTVSGIGPVLAKRIVKKFGRETFDIFDNEPDRLLDVRGIGNKNINEIKDGWKRQTSMRSLVMFLQDHGISQTLAGKLYRAYGENAAEILREDPYRLANEVWGVGFKTADDIADKLGVSKTASSRIRAGICYTMETNATYGNCYISMEDLPLKSDDLLSVGSEKINGCIDNLIKDEELILDEGHVYLPKYYYAEISVAGNLMRIMSGRSKSVSIPGQMFTANGSPYDKIQMDAIHGALKNKVFYITGGPGTGKTTITEGIIRSFENAGLDVLLAAPTGRAAKRMPASGRSKPKTIHRLLQSNALGSFEKNADNRLEGDVLIVDECSMIDLSLMNSLLKAIPGTMHLILVGDADQLPSVGAGNVLKDIIASGCIPGITLTHIFRQAAKSRIVTNASLINQRNMPDCSVSDDSNYFFSSTQNDAEAADKTVKFCTENLPAYYHVDPVKDIQVLSPMKKGPCGTIELNMRLRDVLNPDGNEAPGNFRVGDKVMQIRNDYDKGVYNGDIGFITYANKEIMYVRFEDEGIVSYKKEETDELVLAYATTIHKAQGSEYKIVVMPFTKGHYVMLNKNLLYTGVTRAKEVFVMVGDLQAVEIAVHREGSGQRFTTLAQRITEKSGESS